MKIQFSKMNGAGNDFVVIDNRSMRIVQRSHLARHLCDRHRGIGADGLLLLERSKKAAYRMMYYNADGSYGGMCGNGGRCIASFAATQGIAPRNHFFEALDYVYRAQIRLGGGQVRLWMKPPRHMRIGNSLEYEDDILSVHTIDTGSPHAVVFVQKGRLKGLDIENVGRWLRRHAAFQPTGVNANFVEKTGPRSIKMRTYERGVEAETQACGTGSVACSVLGSVVAGLRSPVSVATRSGDILKVSFVRSDDGFQEVVLEGPATVSFKGQVDV